MMKTIHEYKDQELQWLHPNKFKGVYELRGGDEVFARFHLKGTCGSQIVAETVNGNWIIQRKGFGQSIAILKSRFTNGTGRYKTQHEWPVHPPHFRWSRVQVALYKFLARCLDLAQ